MSVNNMAPPAGTHGEDSVFNPTEAMSKGAHCSSMEQYKQMYEQSVNDPEKFWSKIAEDFYWKSPPTGKFLDYNFDVRNGPIQIKWMQGAVTNMCYNMLDRNVKRGLGDNIAFYW